HETPDAAPRVVRVDAPRPHRRRRHRRPRPPGGRVMATAGMENLVAHVRRLAAAGTAEYTAADTTWWTDDQIEAVLDGHRRDIVGEQLTPEKTMVGGGSAEWRTYRSRYRNLGGVVTIED